MGCASSKAANVQNSRMENQLQNMMGTMMQQVQQLQQESTARQQQMARDDPECKSLLDKMHDLQRRSLAAHSSGDQAEISRIQYESMELNKNPKYLQMMMPSASTLKNFKRTTLPSSKAIKKVKLTTGTNYHTTSSYANNTFAPASYMSSSNYKNNDNCEGTCDNTGDIGTSMFSQLAMGSGMGGNGFDVGMTATTGEGGASSGFDFASSGGWNNNYGSSGGDVGSSGF